MASRPTCSIRVETPALGALQLDSAVLDLVETRGGVEAGLDLHRKVDLLRRREQRDLADLLEVHAHGVAGQRRDRARLRALLGLLLRALGRRLRQRDLDLGLHVCRYVVDQIDDLRVRANADLRVDLDVDRVHVDNPRAALCRGHPVVHDVDAGVRKNV